MCSACCVPAVCMYACCVPAVCIYACCVRAVCMYACCVQALCVCVHACACSVCVCACMCMLCACMCVHVHALCMCVRVCACSLGVCMLVHTCTCSVHVCASVSIRVHARCMHVHAQCTLHACVNARSTRRGLRGEMLPRRVSFIRGVWNLQAGPAPSKGRRSISGILDGFMGPLCGRINAILTSPPMFVQQINGGCIAPPARRGRVRVSSMPPVLLLGDGDVGVPLPTLPRLILMSSNSELISQAARGSPSAN